MLCAALLGALLAGQPADSARPVAGVVAEVRVQGNAVTSESDVIDLAGVHPGDPFDANTVARVEAALVASKRFEHVQVLQRFASLSDPTQILLVVIVDEGPLKLKGKGQGTRIVRSGGPHLLFLPLLGYEDGYGLTYGAELAHPDPIGARSRLAFPLTWGADKRAGVDLGKEFSGGPFTRALASFSFSRRTNPFYNTDDDRVRFNVRGERQIVKEVTAGVSASVQHVGFLGASDRMTDAGVDVVVDTRRDPMLARNAVYARAALDRLGVAGGVSATHTAVEGRGYIGLFGQTTLVLRALRDGADGPLPPYLKPLLGGMDTLRGFAAGYKAGDTLVAGSTELRVPLTSPLRLGKFGVRAFADGGTAYQYGQRYRDQTIDHGVGGGVWFAATAFKLNVDVAHGLGASTRVHVGASVGF
jgi:outer membrane protein assembly factor BamA